jgi:hypothetical protein
LAIDGADFIAFFHCVSPFGRFGKGNSERAGSQVISSTLLVFFELQEVEKGRANGILGER